MTIYRSQQVLVHLLLPKSSNVHHVAIESEIENDHDTVVLWALPYSRYKGMSITNEAEHNLLTHSVHGHDHHILLCHRKERLVHKLVDHNCHHDFCCDLSLCRDYCDL